GLTTRVEVSGLTFPVGVSTVSGAQAVPAFPNLSFDQPVYIAWAPGDSSLVYVVEHPGTIRRFANDAGTTTSEVFLDLTDRVSSATQEEGLIGFAFHPDFPATPHIYVHYSLISPRRSRLSRITLGGDGLGDPSTETTFLEFSQPFGNHNGGMLAFGPDGKLYISVGDGGSANDPQNNAQDRSNLLGNMLRLNDDGSIPDDNPFVGTAGVRAEIWAYGLRNPWRFSFDRETGEIWLGDVGQSAFEEIDIIERGANYGWRLFEGERENINPSGLEFSSFAEPVHTYGRSVGASVTGGYVYRGTAYPSLVGKYIYGDFSSGRVFALTSVGGDVIQDEELFTMSRPSSFGEDPDGEIYICSFGGSLFRLEASEDEVEPESPPANLSETGLFSDLSSLDPSPGLIEYSVNWSFWSDGATKRRWIALPGSARIGFSEATAWNFPVGTVIVKHFELAGADTSIRVETRVLVRSLSSWDGYTYQWNDAGTDAALVNEATTADYEVATADGGTETQTWSFPAGQCSRCHTDVAGFVLGVGTAQLNRDHDYVLLADNQLRAWNHISLFDADLFEGVDDNPAIYAALPNENEEGTATERARAYLDVNCAMCHQPDGPTTSTLDLRFDTAESDLQALDVVPVGETFGLETPRLVTPGTKEASTLWLRMGTTDEGTRMPPVSILNVDEAGVDLIGEWIDSLGSE
ncbi:MAG: PQQ-dependent sugar dehydrogenase, partial [Planctomycetota bacterium]